MKGKEIIPSLELDSNQFEEKVLISLEKTGNVRIVPKNLSGREEDMKRFAFALMNTGSSKKLICPACCSRMTNMALFGVSMDKIREWMISKGEIDPYDLMRDAIEDGIKKGDVIVQEGSLKDARENNDSHKQSKSQEKKNE